MIRLLKCREEPYYLLRTEKACPHCGRDTSLLRILGRVAEVSDTDVVFLPLAAGEEILPQSLVRFLENRFPFWAPARDDAKQAGLMTTHRCGQCHRGIAEAWLYQDLEDLRGSPLEGLFMAWENEDQDGESLIVGQCPTGLLDPWVEEEVSYE